jgi:predicted GNAT family N-acyltransferase
MKYAVIDFKSKQYQQMTDLRYQVLRKPLGLRFTPEQLAAEEHDILLGCFDDSGSELLGCSVLSTVDSNTLQLRQMAVATEQQGNGIGRSLIEYAEEVATCMGITKIILHARKSVEGFYLKLGYNIVGDEFVEVTIPHYYMEKEIG